VAFSLSSFSTLFLIVLWQLELQFVRLAAIALQTLSFLLLYAYFCPRAAFVFLPTQCCSCLIVSSLVSCDARSTGFEDGQLLCRTLNLELQVSSDFML
jgi:hypothetical protein